MPINKSKIVRFALDRTSIITIIQFHIIIGLIIYINDEQSYFQPNLAIYPVCCGLLGLIIWSFWSWYIVAKNLFDPYILFLIATCLFNAGQAVLEIFNLNKDGFLNDRFSSELLLETLFIVMLSLAALHLGALLSFGGAKTTTSPSDSETKSIFYNDKATYWVGLSLLAISFFPTLLHMKNYISIVISSGYAGLYQTETPTGLAAAARILSIFIIPASLFLLAGSQKRFYGKILALGAIATHVTFYFFLGLRNAAIIPLINFAWLWHYKIARLPMLILLSVGLFVMAIVSPIIAMTRNITGQDRFSIDFLIDMFSTMENPLVTFISEAGFSMSTIAYTMYLVPSSINFHNGSDYLYALLTLMPNLFWKIHPTVAHGTPTSWLVQQINPWAADRGFSYGFSFIAEAYLNFGWFGTPIVVGLIGFLLGKLRLWAVSSKEPQRMAMLASFISFFLFYARADSALQIRPLVWFSLLPYLCVQIILSKYNTSSK
ncbi:MAG TPA: O-antigen polysaccharide polymerase Wzy [Leptolyngbyaceae cyanobacterium]